MESSRKFLQYFSGLRGFGVSGEFQGRFKKFQGGLWGSQKKLSRILEISGDYSGASGFHRISGKFRTISGSLNRFRRVSEIFWQVSRSFRDVIGGIRRIRGRMKSDEWVPVKCSGVPGALKGF